MKNKRPKPRHILLKCETAGIETWSEILSQWGHGGKNSWRNKNHHLIKILQQQHQGLEDNGATWSFKEKWFSNYIPYLAKPDKIELRYFLYARTQKTFRSIWLFWCGNKPRDKRNKKMTWDPRNRISNDC